MYRLRCESERSLDRVIGGDAITPSGVEPSGICLIFHRARTTGGERAARRIVARVAGSNAVMRARVFYAPAARHMRANTRR